MAAILLISIGTAAVPGPSSVSPPLGRSNGGNEEVESARELPIIGLGAHQLNDRSLTALQNIGIRHIRTTLYPSLWHQDGQWKREFEAGLAAAEKMGMELLVVVHHPDSTRKSPAERAREADEFSATMARFASQYRGKIRYWQIWNEMDVGFTDAFGALSGLPMGERGRLYAAQLKLAYTAIKASDPDAVVVTGGIASSPADGFLESVLVHGGSFDVAAVHTYGFPLGGVFHRRADQARRLLDEHGLADRPLWNTEFGLEAKQLPTRTPVRLIDALQRSAWACVLRLNDEHHLYDRSYGYQLWTEQDTGHGILRRDWSFRPAAEWLRNYMLRRETHSAADPVCSAAERNS